MSRVSFVGLKMTGRIHSLHAREKNNIYFSLLHIYSFMRKRDRERDEKNDIHEILTGCEIKFNEKRNVSTWSE